MPRRSNLCVLTFALLLLISIVSCSRGPATIKPPSISPSGTASAAMKEYDTNGDGFLSADELDKAPSLKEAIGTLDADKDGKVSSDEIADRIKKWQATEIGVLEFKCEVKLDGRPLGGADVQFEPDSFMENTVLAGGGETDDQGAVIPRIPKEKRPYRNMGAGLQTGFYRIRISKKMNGKETIPARYNTDTMLGHQIAIDDEALTTAHKILLNLTTK
jgi:hypothetical protein